MESQSTILVGITIITVHGPVVEGHPDLANSGETYEL